MRHDRRWRTLPAIKHLAALFFVTITGCNRAPIDTFFKDAEASLKKGDTQIALDQAEAGLRRCGSSPESCWKFRLLKADSLIGLSQNQAAFDLLEGAGKPPDFEIQARRCMLEGWASYHLSEYLRAAKLLEEAHRLAEASQPYPLLAEVELRQAPLLQHLKKFDEADATLRHALELATRAHDSNMQAQVTHNLGFLFNGLFRFDEAIYWFDRSLALSKQTGDSTLTAQAVGNLGLCYYYLGDLEKALANFAEAESRFARIGNVRSQGTWLGNSGSIFLENEEFPEAIERSQRALKMARDISDKPHSIDWLSNLAQANVAIGQLDAAEAYNKEGLDLAEAIGIGATRQRLYLQLNAARIAALRKQFVPAAEIYKSLANSTFEDPTPALEAQGGLANLYIQTGEPQKAEVQFRKAITIIESRQTGIKKVDYKLSYLSSLVRFYRSHVDFLLQRGETSRALEVVESSRARILMERLTNLTPQRSVSAAQLQALARASNRIFLSYWLAPKQSYVWVISPANIRMIQLPPEKEIRASVDAYRTVIDDIRDPLESRNPAGAKLSATLLSPIRESVPPGSHVVIIPDGALHSLNFGTLPSPADPRKYWIEDVTLAVAPSLELMLNAPAANKPHHKSLLAIGDPVSPAEEFPRLPNARKEVDAIAALFADADKMVHVGPTAQPSAYRQANLARFSFIHFAAHATANRATPLDSALILSREGNSYALTAREIMKVPLDARLVTLSSCRSAGARAYSGEGLVGLTWAFLQAGARNVIAGLWDVDDESTSRLMSRIYQDLTHDVPPDDALRTAQLNLIHDAKSPYHKPYYWGPFQLYIGTKEQ